MRITKISLIVFALGLLISCSPDEGKGGLASIEGVVMVQNLNALQEQSGAPYPATDYDVYISYGNSGLADDKTRTSHNGVFQFSNLTKGEYSVFVYSDDTVSNAKYPRLTFSQSVSLDSKKDEAKVDQFTVYRHMDYDDGNGVATGHVKEYLCTTVGTLTSIEDSIPSQETSVYLQYENSDIILERYRTDADGNFTISQLIPGKYRVFALSEESKIPADPQTASYKHFEITDNGTTVVIPEITIKNFK
ncbi:MAG: hypothetical protein IK117_01290 [Bacteroidales bacterium]|nr:hypothetical protein [Bacteroidales bacterium]